MIYFQIDRVAIEGWQVGLPTPKSDLAWTWNGIPDSGWEVLRTTESRSPCKEEWLPFRFIFSRNYTSWSLKPHQKLCQGTRAFYWPASSATSPPSHSAWSTLTSWLLLKHFRHVSHRALCQGRPLYSSPRCSCDSLLLLLNWMSPSQQGPLWSACVHTCYDLLCCSAFFFLLYLWYSNILDNILIYYV